tara:strand:- start:108 stop:1268 length:1161 start_codon:yes stop_codon:yes gene_type:complete
MPNLVNFESIKNQKVILRLDLNVPLEGGKIVNDFRLRKSIETIKALRLKDNKVIILSHLGRPIEGKVDKSLSLEPIHAYFIEHLDENIKFEREWLSNLNNDLSSLILCENTRFINGEKSNDKSLSKRISELGDIYVFDAFGVAHRKEASTYGVSDYIDYSAGPLLISEINNAQKLLNNFSKPLCTIVSGAKISTKLTLLNTFLEKSDYIILGGGILNTFLAAQGYNIGNSLYESSFIDESKKILNSKNSTKIIFPDDVVCSVDGVLENSQTKDISMIKSNDRILDVGVNSILKYKYILRDSKTVFWNGPLGYVEKTPYDKGTSEIAKIVASSNCFSAIGGGDTVPVIEKLGLNDQFSFLSTGGGALMKFIEGSSMPILKKLGLNNK